MKIICTVLALLICGCAPRLVPRMGRPVPVTTPQAQEQCRVQPQLDWCHGR